MVWLVVRPEHEWVRVHKRKWAHLLHKIVGRGALLVHAKEVVLAFVRGPLLLAISAAFPLPRGIVRIALAFVHTFRDLVRLRIGVGGGWYLEFHSAGRRLVAVFRLPGDCKTLGVLRLGA